MASGLQEKGNLASINNFKCFHFPRDSGCFSRPTPSNHHLHGPEGALPHLLTQVPTSSSNLLFAVLGMPLPPGILAIEPGSLVFWEVTLLTSRWSSSTSGTSPAIGLWLSWLGSCFWSCFGSSRSFQSTWPKSLLGRDTCFFGSTGSFHDLGVLLQGFLPFVSGLKLF